MHPDFLDRLEGAPPRCNRNDPFIVLGRASTRHVLSIQSTGETLETAQQSAELAVSGGRLVDALVVERVCRVHRPPPAPPFVTDFFEEID